MCEYIIYYSCHYRVMETHRVVVGVGSIKRNAIHSVGTVTDKLPIMLSMVNVLLIVFYL